MMLKHGRIGLTRPELFPKLFNVYQQKKNVSPAGRPTITGLEQIGAARCILAMAKPEERERFNQLGKTVTHTIIQRGSPIATENNIFALYKGDRETRFFRVQAVHNKGEMDIDTVYYCEERSDL